MHVCSRERRRGHYWQNFHFASKPVVDVFSWVLFEKLWCAMNRLWMLGQLSVQKECLNRTTGDQILLSMRFEYPFHILPITPQPLASKLFEMRRDFVFGWSRLLLKNTCVCISLSCRRINCSHLAGLQKSTCCLARPTIKTMLWGRHSGTTLKWMCVKIDLSLDTTLWHKWYRLNDG